MSDLPILGQSPEEAAFQPPEEAAFQRRVKALLSEDIQQDRAFIKLLQVWFEEGWDANDEWQDVLGDDT